MHACITGVFLHTLLKQYEKHVNQRRCVEGALKFLPTLEMAVAKAQQGKAPAPNFGDEEEDEEWADVDSTPPDHHNTDCGRGCDERVGKRVRQMVRGRCGWEV